MSIRVPQGLYGVVVTDTSIAKSSSDGSLIYRGYPIQDLAERATYLETAYLVLNGELPKRSELDSFEVSLREYSILPEKVANLLADLPEGAHPMDVLRTGVSALGCVQGGKEELWLAAKMPALVAMSLRDTKGRNPTREPFARMFFRLLTDRQPSSKEEWVFERVLMFYLEHDLNASSFAVRVVSSTQADIFSAVTAGVAALKGPLHGGANEAVAEMIKGISTPEEGVQYVTEMLSQGKKVPGFGHRIYKRVDPRAQLSKQLYRDLAGENDSLYRVCTAIEEKMWQEKKLPANLDFYAAPIFLRFGIPIPLYTPIFAASRVFGWIAHYREQRAENKLIRPDAEYSGPPGRRYIPIEQR